MDRNFDYPWVNLVWPGLTLLLFSGFMYWYFADQVDTPFLPLTIILLAYLWLLFKYTFPFHRVCLKDGEIHVVPLLPFKQSIAETFDNISGYTEIALTIRSKKRVVGGVLRTKDNKQIHLFPNGTKDFNELNDILRELFPRIDDTTGSNH